MCLSASGELFLSLERRMRKSSRFFTLNLLFGEVRVAASPFCLNDPFAALVS